MSWNALPHVLRELKCVVHVVCVQGPSDGVVRDWHTLIRCLARSHYALLSYPDHSSPVHGGLLFVQPNSTLYHEGLQVLERSARGPPLNRSLGWAQAGPVHAAVPPNDHVWMRRRGHTHVVDEGNWDFVGGEVDQGFLFYMTRVRHRLGTDQRLTRCSSPPALPNQSKQ
uniref:Uncharacterized protein n=1 Tax=Haptolina brevifila TaxID=156173 RepID=A0A7S2GPR6_9EUKA|mmetsp:Transcript_42111/g.84552  ORF Transcript_42111/g.84552 Transcript_42111/m.84552 type:complete len:169 (+) Transcript_42111:703-1209(+)